MQVARVSLSSHFLRRVRRLSFSFCAASNRALFCPRLVRWCNGSTRVFGALCHGSNPCRTATSCQKRVCSFYRGGVNGKIIRKPATLQEIFSEEPKMLHWIPP